MKRIIFIYIFLIISIAVLGQTLKSVTISGVVVDETDAPIIGATVSLKDRVNKGVFTDLDGAFTINATEGDILLITYVGYKNYEHLAKGNIKDLKVQLTLNEHQLTEAVITGMGTTQRKISIVGAITTVDVKQLQTPATSIPNMMGGRVAGIITQQRSGEPGKNTSEFWVRGIATFGANDRALVLVDGIEGSLDNIDPADIESFAVLKDASATAVYGVRGANGVIIVTTKKGSSGKLTISGRANLTVSYLNRVPEYLNAYDYALLANEARMVRNDEPIYDNTELYTIKYQLDPDLYPDVNWRKEILNETSLQQTYYLSAQGGGSVARYFLSLGISNESAAYKQDKNSKYNTGIGYGKYTYRSNIDMNLTKSTILNFGIDGAFTNRTEPGNASTDELWYTQLKLTPLSIPKQYSTGQLPALDNQSGGFSPYAMLNSTGLKDYEYTENNFSLALNQDFSFITKGLTFRAQGSLSLKSWTEEKRFVRPSLWRATDRLLNGELDMKMIRDKSPVEYSNKQAQDRKLHFESTLNYEKLFGTDHRFSALVYYYMNDQKYMMEGQKSSLEALPKRYQGISSRLTYGLKDTYFLDVNFGYTGSENFQKGHRFGFFPSAAIGWIPTSYDFMRESLPWLSFLKLRGSYGLVGNDKITDTRFPYLTKMNDNSSTGWGFNSGGIKEDYIGADNLRWEKAKKTNLGIDGKLFNQKIDFTIDYFNDQRDGIFQKRVQIPDYVGLINMPFGNVGKMKSWGTDGSASFSQTINESMSFTVRGSLTYSKNEIQNWESDYKKYPYQSETNWAHQIRRGYISLGLFRDDDDIANSPIQNFGARVRPGDIKYKDVNGDGVINSDDQVPISYPDYPRLMYGFGGEFRYKAFTLGVLFRGTGRTDFYWTQNRGGLGYIPFSGGEAGNVLAIASDPKNRWTPKEYSGTPDTENPNARFPRLSYGYNNNNDQISTFWKGDSKYLRLQELSLNYRLAPDSFKRIGLSAIDIQLVGTDLLVWDNVKLWDPELAPGVGERYPIPSRFALQLYIHF